MTLGFGYAKTLYIESWTKALARSLLGFVTARLCSEQFAEYPDTEITKRGIRTRYHSKWPTWRIGPSKGPLGKKGTVKFGMKESVNPGLRHWLDHYWDL